MIKCFDNAAASSALLNINSSTGKTKGTEDFSRMLNGLSRPALTGQQSSPRLLQDASSNSADNNGTRYLPVPCSDKNIPIDLNLQMIASDLQLEPIATGALIEFLSLGDALVAAGPATADVKKISVNADEVTDAKVTALLPLAMFNLPARSNKFSGVVDADVELLTIPWRLQANAALSYQFTDRRLQGIEDAKNVLTVSDQAALVNPGDRNQLPGVPKNSSVFGHLGSEKALQFYRMAEAASTRAGAIDNARIHLTDSRASFVIWPHRALHWLADNDATTAWVRDYQLEPADTGTLVEALRCFAEQQGFSLRRVMLNGNEVWRTNSHS